MKKGFGFEMLTAKKSRVYVNNKTCSINIPREFGLNAEEVYVNKIGDVIMITPVIRLAETLKQGAKILVALPDEFMAEGLPESIPALREDL